MRRRRPPRLVIELELERRRALVLLDFETDEDERRLRGWLRRSGVTDDLAVALVRLLDDLDALDEGAA